MISDAQLQDILERCQKEYIRSQTITTPELIGKFNDSGIEPMVSDLVMTDPGVDETILDRTMKDCFQRIRKDAALRARKQLLASLADAEKQGDRDKATRLKQELSGMIR